MITPDHIWIGAQKAQSLDPTKLPRTIYESLKLHQHGTKQKVNQTLVS